MVEFQTITLPFSGGLDQKTSANALNPPFLLAAEHAVYRGVSDLNLRPGYARVAQLGSGSALFSLNNELIGLTNTALQAYSTSGGSFVSRGSYDPFSIGYFNVSTAAASQTTPYSAVNSSGIVCTVWNNLISGAHNTIRAKITDISGTTVLAEFEVVNKSTNNCDTPMVFAMSDRFAIFYHYNDGSDHIGFKTVLYSSLALSSEVLVSGKLPAGYYFSTTNKVLLSYVDASSNHRASYVDTAGALTSTTTISTDGATISRIFCAGRLNSGLPENLVLYVSSGTIKVSITNSSMAAQGSTPKVVDSSTATLDKPIGHFDGTQWQCFWTEKSAGSESTSSSIKNTTITTGGVVGTLTTYLRNRVTAGGSFSQNGATYLLAYRYGTTPAFELLTGATAPRLVSTFVNGVAPTTAPVNTFAIPSYSTYFLFPCLSVASGFRDSSFALQPNVVLYSANTTPVPTSESANRSLYLTGPHVYEYDGSNVFEAGFPQPDNIVAIGTTGTGITGTFLYKYTYSYTNAKGVLQESAPSAATTTGSVSNVTNTVTIRNLKLTDKVGGIKINLYRTVNNGTTYYLAQQADNNTSSDTQVINDATTDVVLQTQALAYFNLGTNSQTALTNDPVPRATHLKAYNGRMMALGIADNPYAVAYSKAGQSYAFPASNVQQLPSQDYPTVAGAVIDTNFVVFTSGTIYVMNGFGPDNYGQNSDYTIYRLSTPKDLGCVDPRSIVETSEGVFFDTNNGRYFIDRALQVLYLGAAVENYNSESIVSGIAYPEYHEVRLVTSAGNILVCNMEQVSALTLRTADSVTKGARWTVFPSMAAVGQCIFNKSHCFIKANGDVFQENKTGTDADYNDNGSLIMGRMRMAWFDHDGKELPIYRIRRVTFLGNYSSNMTLTLNVHRNYVNGAAESTSLQAETPATYGANSYGTGSYGGSGRILGRHKLAKQKMYAVSFEITSHTTNASFSLSQVVIEVAVKSGLKDGTNF